MKFDRITQNPNIMNGQPCIRDSRITVRRVLQIVSSYPDRDDLFREYPELEEEDLKEALQYAGLFLHDSFHDRSTA
jgi:uncharacterized protein (DUF433 family)